MGNRYEPRTETRLTVRVSGTDLEGNPFKQTAYAHNVSRRGACLDGIGCLRGPGETIEVEHSGKKAKFFVVWIGLPGTPEHDRIGIRNLDRNQTIWKLSLPAPEPDTFEPPDTEGVFDKQRDVPYQVEEFQNREIGTENAPQFTPPGVPSLVPQATRPDGDRRQFRRYAVDGSATFQVKGTDVRTWGKLSDISPGGCYVESYVPLPVGTELELTLEVAGERVSAEGSVKVIYPGLGMGIEITGASEESAAILQKITSPRWR